MVIKESDTVPGIEEHKDIQKGRETFLIPMLIQLKPRIPNQATRFSPLWHKLRDVFGLESCGWLFTSQIIIEKSG
jgi:hypothetical protein